jgi:hypothetical protein
MVEPESSASSAFYTLLCPAILARRPTRCGIAWARAQDLWGVERCLERLRQLSWPRLPRPGFRVHPEGRVLSVAKVSLALPTGQDAERLGDHVSSEVGQAPALSR